MCYFSSFSLVPRLRFFLQRVHLFWKWLWIAIIIAPVDALVSCAFLSHELFDTIACKHISSLGHKQTNKICTCALFLAAAPPRKTTASEIYTTHSIFEVNRKKTQISSARLTIWSSAFHVHGHINRLGDWVRLANTCIGPLLVSSWVMKHGLATEEFARFMLSIDLHINAIIIIVTREHAQN